VRKLAREWGKIVGEGHRATQCLQSLSVLNKLSGWWFIIRQTGDCSPWATEAGDSAEH